MKLNRLILASHLGASLAGAVLVWSALNWQQNPIAAIVVAAGMGAGLGWWVTRQLLQSLAMIDAVTRTEAPPTLADNGIAEFETLAARVRDVVSRWSDAANTAQQGIREAHELASQLDRRTDGRLAGSGTAASQLRGLLQGVVDSLAPELNQLVTDAGDLEGKLAAFATGTADQTDAISRTTTYVEQLAEQFDSVAASTNTAQQAAQTTRDSTRSAHMLIDEHVLRSQELLARMETTERKVRALRERSESIGTIIETIGAISSRTDLLALNASIESFRAGEQGRGFSIVADEVRKLAEQSAQSTREISRLIEVIQADAEASAAALAEQRTEVGAEISRLQATGRQLSEIGETCETSAARIRDISQLAGQQLHLTQSLVTTVERISESNRRNRTQLEEAGWMVRSIGKGVVHVNETIEPLRIGTPGAPLASTTGRSRRSSADERGGSGRSDERMMGGQTFVPAEAELALGVKG